MKHIRKKVIIMLAAAVAGILCVSCKDLQSEETEIKESPCEVDTQVRHLELPHIAGDVVVQVPETDAQNPCAGKMMGYVYDLAFKHLQECYSFPQCLPTAESPSAFWAMYFDHIEKTVAQWDKEDYEDGEDFENKIHFADTLSIQQVYADDSVVTWRISIYNTLGNTHPMYETTYISFRADNFDRIGWRELVPEEKRRETLEKVLAEVEKTKEKEGDADHVRSYVDLDTIDLTDKGLAEKCQTGEFIFHDPAVVGDKLVFYFHLYELGSHASGEYIVGLKRD